MTRPSYEVPVKNTDSPGVRCGMCGGRCRPIDSWVNGSGAWLEARWIECRGDCLWSSHSPERVGPLWRLRVLVGI